MLRTLNLVVLAALLSLMAGCVDSTDSHGAGSGDPKEDLRHLRTAYSNYHDAHGQGPADWNSLIEAAGQDSEAVAAIQRLKDQGYQVKWGVRTSDATNGIGNFVLAESPQGEPKLMLDGSIVP